MSEEDTRAGFGTGMFLGLGVGFLLTVLLYVSTDKSAMKYSQKYLEQVCSGEWYQIQEEGEEYILFCMTAKSPAREVLNEN